MDAKDRLETLLQAIKELISKIIEKLLELEQDGIISHDFVERARESLEKCKSNIEAIQNVCDELGESEQNVIYDMMFDFKNGIDGFDNALSRVKNFTKEAFEQTFSNIEDKMLSLSEKADEIKNHPVEVKSLSNFDLLDTEFMSSMYVFENKKNEHFVRFKDRPDFYKVVIAENGSVSLEYADLTSAQKASLTNTSDMSPEAIKQVKQEVAKSARVMKFSDSTRDSLGSACIVIGNMAMDIDYKRNKEGKDNIKIGGSRFVPKEDRSKYTEFQSDKNESIDTQIVDAINTLKLDMRDKMLKEVNVYDNAKQTLTEVIKKPNVIYTKNGFNCIYYSKDNTFRITQNDSGEMLVLKDDESNDTILKAELYRGVKSMTQSLDDMKAIDVADWKEQEAAGDRSLIFFNMKADILDSGFSNLSSLMQSEFAKIIVSYRTGVELNDILSTYKDMKERDLQFDSAAMEYHESEGGDFAKLPKIDRIGYAAKRVFEMDGGLGGKYEGFTASRTKGTNFALSSPDGGTLFLNMHKGEMTSIIYKDSKGKSHEVIDKKGNILNENIIASKEFILLDNLTHSILSQSGMENEMKKIAAIERQAKDRLSKSARGSVDKIISGKNPAPHSER